MNGRKEGLLWVEGGGGEPGVLVEGQEKKRKEIRVPARGREDADVQQGDVRPRAAAGKKTLESSLCPHLSISPRRGERTFVCASASRMQIMAAWGKAWKRGRRAAVADTFHSRRTWAEVIRRNRQRSRACVCARARICLSAGGHQLQSEIRLLQKPLCPSLRRALYKGAFIPPI